MAHHLYKPVHEADRLSLSPNLQSIAFKILFPALSLLTLPSCLQVPPQDPARYQAALDAASEDDYQHRDRERRSAAAAYRESGQQAPTYHYHEHRSNNFIGW